MGVDLADIVTQQPINLETLKSKTLAVDAYNALYQFLAIIRQPDGTPLKDKQGRVTSHLSGLLYRTTSLRERGIKLTFIFDGKPPELKQLEIQRRRQVREEATIRYQAAVQEGRIEEARTYAQATSQLKDVMVEDAKRLLTLLGISHIQAPSEGEAQASYMAAKGDVWAVASQDHDSLLFGAPRMIKNLTITGRRKLPRRDAYVEVEPEFIELAKMLQEISITREQLVDVGILIGTDFNNGVKGIGAKTALKLIRENDRLEQLLEKRSEIKLQSNYQSIRDIFLHPQIISDYKLSFSQPDEEKVVSFLCGERDFSEQRVRKAISRIHISESKSSATLESYFS